MSEELRNAFFSKMDSWGTSKPKAPRIVRVFMDVHMGYGHRGLSKVARESDVEIDTLDRGEMIVFLNRKQDAMKVYTAGNTVAHIKMPQGGRIDLRVIKLLPTFFSGGEVRYQSALKRHLKQKLLREAGS